MATVAKATAKAGLEAGLSTPQPAQGSRGLLSEQVAARFAPQNTRRMERLIGHLEVRPTNDKNFQRMTKRYVREIGKLSVLMSCNGAPVNRTGAFDSEPSYLLDYFAVRADGMLELSRLTLEYPSPNQPWWKLYNGGLLLDEAAIRRLIQRLQVRSYAELSKALSVLAKSYVSIRAESSQPRPKTLKINQRWKQRDREWRLQRVAEKPHCYRLDTVITR